MVVAIERRVLAAKLFLRRERENPTSRVER